MKIESSSFSETLSQKQLLDREYSRELQDESVIGEVLHEFETPEFVEEERGKTWFIGMALFIVTGVLVGIFQESLSLILVSITLGAVYTLTHNEKPKRIQVRFTNLGVVWREKFYMYQNIKNFWIFWEPGQRKTLHFQIDNGLLREVVIPIHFQKMEKIRDVFGYYVPELEGVKEPLPDVLSRTFKL